MAMALAMPRDDHACDAWRLTAKMTKVDLGSPDFDAHVNERVIHVRINRVERGIPIARANPNAGSRY